MRARRRSEFPWGGRGRFLVRRRRCGKRALTWLPAMAVVLSTVAAGFTALPGCARKPPVERSRAEDHDVRSAPDSGSSSDGPSQIMARALAFPGPDDPLPATAGELSGEVELIVDELAEAFPRNPDCLELKARVEVWLGNSREACTLRKKCLEIAPNYVHAYVGMAESAAARGDHEEAARCAQKVIELDPNHVAARVAAAKALIRLAKMEEAIQVLQWEFPPQSSEHYSLRGQAYLQLDKLDQAIKNYEAAIRVNPRRAEALYGLYLAHSRLRETDKANQYLETYREVRLAQPTGGMLRQTKLIDLQSMIAPAAVFYVQAATICLSQRRRDDAVRLLLRVERLDPTNADSRWALVQYYRSVGDFRAALERLKSLAKLQPSNGAVWIQTGEVCVELGDLEGAEQAFRHAVQVAPGWAEAFASLAAFSIRANRNLEEAIGWAQKAVDLTPTAANYALLAAAYRHIGDQRRAVAALEQALRLEPENVAYRQMLQEMRTLATN